jgi:hypothetical protein
MKITKIFLLTICLGLAFMANAQTPDYDLNLKTVRNDAKAGGELHVVVQIRATAAKSTFDIADFTLRLAFSNQALSIGNTPTVNVSKYSWSSSFTNHLASRFVTFNAGTNLHEVVWQQTDFNTGNIPTTPLTISQGWVDMIEFRFDIVSAEVAYTLIALGSGTQGPGSFNVREVIGGNSLSPVLVLGQGFTEVSFNGTNWTGGNGPGGIPDITDGCKRMVVSSGTATLVGHIECDFFRVAPGAKLVVGPNATLRPFMQNLQNSQFPTLSDFSYQVHSADDFIIDADANGYGQYIGPGVLGTIKQWIGTTSGWRNLSFPVSSGVGFNIGGSAGGFDANSTSFNSNPNCEGTWGNAINTVSVYRFNKGGPEPHEWYGAASAPTGGTEGFSVFAGGFFGTGGIATIKGTFLDPKTSLNYSYSHQAPHIAGGTGSQSAVTQQPGCINESVEDRQANWNGWALVGNPFPCNLDVNMFADDNGFNPNQIRIWNRNTNTYLTPQADGGSSTTTVAPMQAFWLKIGESGDNITLHFNASQRVFDAAQFFKYDGHYISLNAANDATGEQSEIFMQFNGQANKGYDMSYDSYAMSQSGLSVPQLAFHNTYNVNGVQVVAPLDHNTVPEVLYSDSYPLRFWSRAAGDFTFTVDTATMLPTWHVYIEDKLLAPGTFNDITKKGYSFSYDPLTDHTTRFVMYFAPSGNLDIRDEVKSQNSLNCFAYNDDEGIRVAFENYPFDQVNIQIFNAIGQLLKDDKRVNTNEVYLYSKVNNSIGYYVVIVNNPDGTIHSFKVIR